MKLLLLYRMAWGPTHNSTFGVDKEGGGGWGRGRSGGGGREGGGGGRLFILLRYQLDRFLVYTDLIYLCKSPFFVFVFVFVLSGGTYTYTHTHIKCNPPV